ncbi:MAG: triose-phosphate isomerase [Gammaproteobacteria bacterium]
MQRRFIAGNWKMNGSSAQLQALLMQLKKLCQPLPACEFIVFPAFVYLPLAQQILSDSCIKVGAQNVSEFDNGAYTGEVSSMMLHDVGCHYVLVGHSERRQLLRESDEQIAQKYIKAKQVGLTPIVCVGETLKQREQGLTHTVIQEQLTAIFTLAKNDNALLNNMIIAYEPVWAIGSGQAAQPEEAQQVHSFIRHYVSDVLQSQTSNIAILYGGSLKPANARDLFAMPDIDGGLIGGASLDAQQFWEIAQCIN